MPQPVLVFRALVASPGDCAVERKIIPEVIAAWNAVHSESDAAVIEPVMWETHSRPAMGNRPQAIINRQLVERCDLLIGAFWTRLGTPTGVAESGTAEEIEAFRAANKPVLLYFSAVPVVPDSVDHAQYQALVAYRDRLRTEGLYSRYESHAEFREQLQRHLAGTMISLLGQASHLRADSVLPVPVPVAARPEPPDPLAEARAAIESFQSSYDAFLRRLRAAWAAERDSDPINTDEGKWILSRAADDVVHFRSMITDDTVGLGAVLDDASRRLRALQRHQVFIDGGRSFRAFWAEGDAIIEALGAVPDLLARAASDASPRPSA